MQYNEIIKARFWAKVNIPDEVNSCWEWKAGVNRDNRGNFSIGGKTITASRAAYAIANNILVEDIEFQILHHCDNVLCVNPEHLYEGTNDQNMRDKVKRNRTHKPKGELHPNAMLTRHFIKEITFLKGHIRPKEIEDNK